MKKQLYGNLLVLLLFAFESVAVSPICRNSIKDLQRQISMLSEEKRGEVYKLSKQVSCPENLLLRFEKQDKERCEKWYKLGYAYARTLKIDSTSPQWKLLIYASENKEQIEVIAWEKGIIDAVSIEELRFQSLLFRHKKGVQFPPKRILYSYCERLQIINSKQIQYNNKDIWFLLSHRKDNDKKIQRISPFDAYFKKRSIDNVSVFVNNIKITNLNTDAVIVDFIVYGFPTNKRYFLGDTFLFSCKKKDLPKWVKLRAKLTLLFDKNKNSILGIARKGGSLK